MTDNPDSRAKLLVAALIGAWLLAIGTVFVSDVETARWWRRFIRWAFLLALFGFPLVTFYTNRRRVRDAVESAGGQITRLRALPFLQQDWWHFWAIHRGRNAPKFEVHYTDLLGRRHVAVLRSNFSHGAVWVSDTALD